MKLRRFDKVNANRRARITNPAVSISKYNGRIAFNIPAADLLQLENKDRILIFQDLEDRSSWYMKKTDEASGFNCVKKKDGAYHEFYSTVAVDELFRSIGMVNEKSVKLRLKSNPFMGNKATGPLYQLITRDE